MESQMQPTSPTPSLSAEKKPGTQARGNPDLAGIKAEVEKMAKGLPKPLAQSYESIVTAGMKLMWSDETHQLLAEYLQSIKNPAQIPQLVAHAIIKGISIIIKEVNVPNDLGDPFYAASMLASKYLMCDALEYVEQRGQAIDRRIIDQTTQQLTSGMFALYGINEEQMQSAANLAEETMARQPAQSAAPMAEQQGTGLLSQA